MKFAEYVVIKEEYSAEGIYATFKSVLSESTNPRARKITDEQLMEVGNWLTQGIKGIWGAAKTAAGDVWNAIKNTPAQVAKAGQEYSTSFKLSKELAKIQDLLNAMDIVEKEILPKHRSMASYEADGEHPSGLTSDDFKRAFDLIKNELTQYLNDAKEKQSEFQAQRRDQAGVRYPAASGSQDSRLPGHDARERARKEAEAAGAKGARPGAR